MASVLSRISQSVILPTDRLYYFKTTKYDNLCIGGPLWKRQYEKKYPTKEANDTRKAILPNGGEKDEIFRIDRKRYRPKKGW